MKKAFLNITYGVLIGLLSAGVIWLAARSPAGEAVALLPTVTGAPLTVYVTGAVATPGVYRLPEDSRINDALEAAGGFAEGAERDRINLAEPVEDGMQIDIPGIVESARVDGGRVDINTATLDELDGLPGIGPTAAQAIIDYRQANGDFQVIQDIQNVPGIGATTFERIRDYITVGP